MTVENAKRGKRGRKTNKAFEMQVELVPFYSCH